MAKSPHVLSDAGIEIVALGEGQLLAASGAILSGFLGAVGRDASYAGNRSVSILCPPPDVYVRQYYAGMFGSVGSDDAFDALRRRLWENGIHFEADVVSGSTEWNLQRAQGWYDWVKLQQPTLDLGTLLAEWRWSQSTDSVNRLRFWTKKQGLSDDDLQVIMRQSEDPGLPALASAVNRGLLGKGAADIWLRYGGQTSSSMRNILLEMATNQIPSPTQLIQYGIKDVWDQQVVSALGYDDDFPYPLEYYLKQQGFHGSVDLAGPDGTAYPALTWAKAEWRAHWRNIAPGMWFSMLRELTPRRISQMPLQLQGILPLGIDDVLRGLKIADYPPAIRSRIAALAYRTLPVRYISRLGINHEIDVNTASAMYQELGYLPHDATKLATSDRQSESIAYRRANRGKLRACVLEKYRIGTITAETAIANLAATGLSEHTATAAVNTALCETAVITAKAAVRSTRSKYLRGYLDAAAAKTQLQIVGIIDSKIEDYLTLWSLENTPARKEFTSAKIVSFAEQGLLTIPQAIVRLSNLGWKQADLLLLAARINAGIASAQSRAEKALERQQERQAAALQRAADHAKALHRQAVAMLRRSEPLGVLKKALQTGEISPATFKSRLTSQEYSQEAIQLLVEQYGPKG